MTIKETISHLCSASLLLYSSSPSLKPSAVKCVICRLATCLCRTDGDDLSETLAAQLVYALFLWHLIEPDTLQCED